MIAFGGRIENGLCNGSFSSFGLLVNFGHRILEYKRVHHPLFHPAAEGDHASEADLVF